MAAGASLTLAWYVPALRLLKMLPMLPEGRSTKCPWLRIRSRSWSHCCCVRGIRWFSGCNSCAAREVPAPRARNKIRVRIWKLGMLEPAESASSQAILNRASTETMRSPLSTLKSMRAVPE
eukprot:5196548-Pyramimonas_sp.AAC.1